MHFAVMVIGNNPEKQLKPFKEYLETPRNVSKKQLINRSKKQVKKYEKGTYAEYIKNPEYIKSFNKPYQEYISKEFPKKLQWSDEEHYKEATRFYEINEDGSVDTVDNENPEWNWYQLGGRYAGLIELKDNVDKNIYKSLNCSCYWDDKKIHKKLDSNVVDQAYIEDIKNLDKLRSFSLLKDGKWSERGINKKDINLWNNEQQKLLKGLSKDTLISIYDCYI